MQEPNGSHRALQRSQSLQPSTATAPASYPSQQYHQLQQQKFYLNNYTNHQNSSSSSHKPNTHAPHAKIARINSSPALPSTKPTATITSEQHQLQQKQLPAPLNFPIQISYNIDGAGSAMESPAVKIDYSKFTLPATSPSIKIDLSNFNQQMTKQTSSSGLDEDYDIWAVAQHVLLLFFTFLTTKFRFSSRLGHFYVFDKNCRLLFWD